MRFVKLMDNSFENASRNKRELEVVKNLNLEIIVVARGDDNRIIHKEGYLLHELSTKPFGKASYLTFFNRILCVVTWAIYVRHLRPDFISCHGIVALGIGWLSTLFACKNKPKLIYDSHEFELGIDKIKPRGYLRTQLIRIAEKFLIHKSAITIVVSDSIADELKKIHSLKTRPIVVRNIPSNWNVNAHICEEKRQEIIKKFMITNKMNDNILISMYHGVIMQGRGIETIIKTLGITENVYLVVLGYGTHDYIKTLKKLCRLEKVRERVIFLPAVPLDNLWQYIGAADVGMITYPNKAKNYYFMLPNKLFENIQSLTPIICSNSPDITNLVATYKIGIPVDPSDINEISKALIQMRDHTEMNHLFKHNLIKAKAELCWEKESEILVNAYKNLLK